MKTRPPPSNGGLRSTRTGGPRTLQHWSLSHALSPSQGHISFEGKGYDVLFIRHTLNGLQNSSDSQAVERRGYGHSAAGVQLRISDGANPHDTSVSTSFSTQYCHSLHFSLLFRQQFPQRTTDLITLCKATWRNAGKSLGVRIQLWGSPCLGKGLPDPQTPSRGPGAPQPQAPPHLGSMKLRQDGLPVRH